MSQIWDYDFFNKSWPHNKRHKQTTLWRTEKLYTVSHYILRPQNQNMIPKYPKHWVSRFANLVVKQVQTSVGLTTYSKLDRSTSCVLRRCFCENNSVFIGWTTTAANLSDLLIWIFQKFINLFGAFLLGQGAKDRSLVLLDWTKIEDNVLSCCSKFSCLFRKK